MAGDSPPAVHFLGTDWETRPPEDLGFDAAKLASIWTRLLEGLREEQPARVCVVRGGYLAAERCVGIGPEKRVGQASVAGSQLPAGVVAALEG